METITWVGINHYVEEGELDAFYSSLKEGDVVCLVPEPENFWDSKAVAVFYRYLMRGHVSRHETDKVHLMDKYNMELIGRVTDDIDSELNQVKITVDSVSVVDEKENVYPLLSSSVLGIEMNPHIMYEEYSYKEIKKAVDRWVGTIKLSNMDSDVVGVGVKEIKSALDVYLTIWDHSISIEANVLPRYFDDLLTDLSKISSSVKTELKPYLVKLRRCTAKQPKMENNIDVFNRQVDALEKIYSAEGGFYDAFDKFYANRESELRKRLKALDKWLRSLTSSKNTFYNDDFKGFVHLIYCFGYRAKELYVIITHLLLLRHISVLLYQVPSNIKIEKLITARDTNFYGKAEISEMVNN